MTRAELSSLLDGLLEPSKWNDVGENGLQVEGAAHIERVVCGVTANRALIERTIDVQAQAIVVHHGIVWGGGMRNLTGWLKQRVRLLFEHDINLFAYHLPLDAHPDVGNNRGVADALDVTALAPFGRFKGQSVGVRGVFGSPHTLTSLREKVRERITNGAPVFAFGDESRAITSVGICTGGAPDLLLEAVSLGLDAYITGEVTEYVKAVAEESGTVFLGVGHHASERFGPRALTSYLCERGIDAQFIDVDNPV